MQKNYRFTLDIDERAAPKLHLAEINKLIERVFKEKTSLRLQDYYECGGELHTVMMELLVEALPCSDYIERLRALSQNDAKCLE